MLSKRIRQQIATHCLWWCAAWVLLAALQPFIAVHFRQDGWEDEPGFRIRTAGTVAQFEPDDRADHGQDLEATVFVPTSAAIDLPDALQSGLDGLMSMVFLALPLVVVLAWLVVRVVDVAPRRPERNSGPPPARLCWRTFPPPTAPPLTA